MPKRQIVILSAVLLLLPCLALVFAPTHSAAQTVPTATPTPILSPTPTLPFAVVPSFGDCAAPLALEIGQVVSVRGGVNLRNLPSRSGGIVNYFAENTLVTIIEGPTCADGINWWRVDGPGNTGWVAEGDGGRLFITLLASDAARGCAAPLSFFAGARVRMINNVRLRDNATTAGLVLTIVPAGDLATVLAGPICADGYNWWLLEANVVNRLYRGWAAEGPAGEYFYEVENAAELAAGACAPALGWVVGTAGYVDLPIGAPARSLRSAPGRDSAELAQLVHGTPFVVIGAPVCADGTNWWYIRLRGNIALQGWLSEGGPTGYVISRISLTPVPPGAP